MSGFYINVITNETNENGEPISVRKLAIEGSLTLAQLQRLIAAAKPFLSGDAVDETSGTIPLVEELRAAIEDAEKSIS